MRNSILYLFILFSSSICAQNYQGSVTDSENRQVLDGVIIGLLRTDSLITDYTYTDIKGRFSISSKTNVPTKFISLSLLGYEPRLIAIKDFHNGMQISMKSKVFKIKEVKVISKRLVEKKDTLIYSVSGFKMPQDKNIADVLKKLPGIEVRTDGKIEYQGKAISQFYIEGMNLLEGKYSLASNNLSADKVREVQVLRNHQSIKALKGINFSDQAALNLVLRDNAKAQVIGSADIEGGAEAQKNSDVLWNNRLIGMLFGSHYQNLTMYKNNNTGKNIQSELSNLTQEIYLGKRGINDENGFLSLNNTGLGLSLNRDRFLFNNSHLVTTNQLWKPNKENDFRLQLSYLHDRQKNTLETNTTYLFPDNQMVINELKDHESKKNQLDGEFTFKRNTQSLYINNIFKGYTDFGTGYSSILVNDSKQQQTIESKKQIYRNDFELIHRKENRSFSFSTINSYTNIPQSLLMTPGPEGYNSLMQDIRLKSFNSNSYTYFKHRLWKAYIQYKAGIKIRQQALTSNLYEKDNIIVDNDLYINDANYLELTGYIEPSVTYIHNDLQIEVSLAASVNNMHIKNKTSVANKNTKTHFLPEPALKINYQLTPFWKITGNASYTHSFGDIHELYSGYIFTSYRMASVYSDGFSIDKRQSYSTGMQYSNPLTSLFGYFNIAYSSTHRNLFYDRTITGNMEERKAVYTPTTNPVFSASGRISKAFSFWRSNVALSAYYTSMKNTQILQGEWFRFRTQNINTMFSAGIQPCRFLNFEEKSSYLYSKLHSDLDSKPVHSFQHTLICNILPDEHWKIKWNNELYHSNDKRVSTTFFSDISVLYSIREWEFGINAQNIFNNHSFAQEYVGNMEETYTKFYLRPAGITAKVSFSF